MNIISESRAILGQLRGPQKLVLLRIFIVINIGAFLLATWNPFDNAWTDVAFLCAVYALESCFMLWLGLKRGIGFRRQAAGFAVTSFATVVRPEPVIKRYFGMAALSLAASVLAGLIVTNMNDKLSFKGGRRLPVVHQNEASECGLACLSMLAGYYGNNRSLAELRQKFSLSLRGVTVNKLMEMAQQLGLSSRAVRLEVHELDRLVLPCILHWNMDHFVVLKRIKKGKITIHDPAVGERTVSRDQINKLFTGVALELSIGPNFQRKAPEPPISLRRLSGSVVGLTRSLITIFTLAFALEVFGLLSPQFLQVTVDQVLSDGDHDLLGVIGTGFLVVLVLQVIISFLRSWTVMWLNTHLSLAWTGNVFQHLMRLPQTYFLKRHLGDVVSRFGAIDVIQRTLTTQFVSVVLDGIMGALTLAVMVAYSPLLAGLTSLALVIYAVTRLIYFRVYRESNLSQIVVSAKQQSKFLESVRGIQTIKLYNQTASQTSRYLNATSDSLNTAIAVQRLNLLFGAINGLTGGAQRVAVLWVGAWLALKNDMTAGMLMAYVAYSDQFSGRAASLVDYLIQLRLMRLQGERLADIVTTPIEKFTEGTYGGPTPEPSLKLENVSFRYADGEPWIISGATFEIKKGESVAIVGPSGCGKTTLIRLLLGLVDPSSGTIKVGGVDLKSLGKSYYRDIVASVMQDDTLFSGTIADNISLFDESAAIDRIESAARRAQLHDDVAALAMGYQTLVGDMGSTLSGGQQQRLHIARALYKTPAILILDEATSHLDIEREAEINAYLQGSSITRVIVAHRQQTINSADRVLACVGGKVIEVRSKTTSEQPAESDSTRSPSQDA